MVGTCKRSPFVDLEAFRYLSKYHFREIKYNGILKR
jgi:hypothetical protein